MPTTTNGSHSHLASESLKLLDNSNNNNTQSIGKRSRQMFLSWRLSRFRIAVFLPTICIWFLEQKSLINVTKIGDEVLTLAPANHPSITWSIESDNQTTSQRYHTSSHHTPQILNYNITRKYSDEIEWQHRRNDLDYLQQLFPGPRIVNHNTTSSCQGERVLDEIQIHVITWKRDIELASLLDSLQTANYTGYHQKNLPLYIHIDGGGEREVKRKARQFKWEHGSKHVDVRKENVGLREMWLTSLRAAADKRNNTLMVVLEDDMVLSPLYFQWLLQMVDHYARNPECRDSNLVGFSLSSIVYQNMYKPFFNWSADVELGPYVPFGSPGRRHSVYLSTIPSSWGGVFWSDVWNRFDSFVQERVKPPLYNLPAEDDPKSKPSTITPAILHLPHDCTTNTWTKSWKRFLVDFMYGRGMWMLYPNLHDNLGLAYARQNSGIHVNKFNKDRTKVEMVDDVSILLRMESDLPSYEQLLLVDLEHAVSSKELVTAQGTLFLNRLAKDCEFCEDVLKKWARPDWNVPSDGYDNFPSLCAADLYTSVTNDALRPTTNSTDNSTESEDTDRYLVITSPTVNRLDAKVWAALLNRRLILIGGANAISPPKSNTTESNGSKLLHAWLSQYASLPVVTFPNSKNTSPLLVDEDLHQINTTSPWRILLLTSTSNKAKNMMVPEIDLRHLFSTQPSLATMQHLLGGCTDKVLVLNDIPTLDFASPTNLTIRLIEENVTQTKPPKKNTPKTYYGGRAKALKEEKAKNPSLKGNKWSDLGKKKKKRSL